MNKPREIRVCRICGKKFPVGRNHARTKNSKTCSKEHSRFYRRVYDAIKKDTIRQLKNRMGVGVPKRNPHP